MIQEYFKTIAASTFPDYKWSIDYFRDEDKTGTVFYEGGGNPSAYETGTRYPNYMIFLRSDLWEQVEEDAEALFQTFHKVENQEFTTSKGKTFQILFIAGQGEPLRLGVRDNQMEYSINFNCTVKEVK